MDSQRFNVIILKTPGTADTAARLAKLLKIDESKAALILHRDAFVIKKEADRETAEKYHQAIIKAGVNCRLDVVEAEETLPEIELVERRQTEAELRDPTQPEIPPEHPQQQLNLSLEKISEKNGDAITDVDEDKFCPECGTIRASADSVCTHCGYDPAMAKKKQRKSMLFKVVLVLAMLATAVMVAYPFYVEHTRRAQLHDDLKLAFDTRNKVTEFIQQTNFWPSQNIDAGLDKVISNRSIKSILIGDDAIITVTIRGEALDGEAQTLIMTPNTLKGRVVWNCLQGSLSERYRPDVCKSLSN